jgi:hypothetical protein
VHPIARAHIVTAAQSLPPQFRAGAGIQ